MDFAQYDSDKKIVEFVLKDVQAMKNDRSNYEPLWKKETAIYQPEKYNFLKEFQDGQQFGKKTYWDYPSLCAHKFALGVTGNMISRKDSWIKFIIQNREKMKSDRVKQYLQDYAEQMTYGFGRSNSFYKSAYWAAKQFAVTGTPVVWTEENKVDGKLEYTNISVGTCYLRRNNYGKYIVFAMECKISNIDLVDKFGQNTLSQEIIKEVKDNPFNQQDLIIYLAYNSKFKTETLNPEDLKYKVFYILPKEKNTEKQMVMKSGRNSFPIVVPYDDSYDIPYGYSIGARCLNTGLVGNKLVELMLDEANKAVGGIWRVSDTIGKLDLRARAVNRVSNANEFIENIYRNMGQWQIGKDQLADLKTICDDYFFINFFQMLSNPDLPQITAYQASKMAMEKVAMMSTAISSFEDYLSAAIELQADFEGSRLPDPPDELFDDNGVVSLQPQFLGNLAQLQTQSFKTKGLVDWATMIANFSPVWPAMKVKVNELDFAEQLAEGLGVPESAVKDDDEVNRILQEMQQAESDTQQTQALIEGAKAVPQLSKKIEAGSPMEMLAGAIK